MKNRLNNKLVYLQEDELTESERYNMRVEERQREIKIEIEISFCMIV